METGTELQNRRDASVSIDFALIWRADSGRQAQQSALAGSIGADDTDALALLHGKAHVTECVETFAQRALEPFPDVGSEQLAIAMHEALGNVLELDGGLHDQR